MQNRSIIFLIFSFFYLISCSSYVKNNADALDVMYAQALSYLNNNDVIEAQELFKQITEEYPYKEEAIEAQIFLIWIYYIQEDLVSAEVNIDAFLKYYVYNDYTPWVTYMNALVKYEQIEIAERDQNATSNALVEFFNIIKRYPDSKFAKDARIKLEVAKYNIAQRHMHVANYYLENKNYLSAINRYQEVVKNFSDTIFVQEALYKLTYIWLTLGVENEAFRTASVLGYNYAHSIWYQEAYKIVSKYSNYRENSHLKPVIGNNN